MTETNYLPKLRTFAKQYARASRMPQHQALDLLAAELGFANWTKLITASKSGWAIEPETIDIAEAFVKEACPASASSMSNNEAMSDRLTCFEQIEYGSIGDHAYRLQDILGDVVMSGDGWSIRVLEDPNAAPEVETFSNPEQNSPILEPEFLQRALKLALDRAALVRAGTSIDWPRRSTKPDLSGASRHPLRGGESDVWFCLRCDGKITGKQTAESLWHCPGCGASPIDIFDTAFWAEDERKSFPPVETNDGAARETSDLQIVDGRPKLDLDEEKIVLLLRSALLDDATNVSEKLAALLAEISFDGEDGVWIILEEDLWPEDKEPDQVLEVSELLGLETEILVGSSKLPFAWPGLGETTSSTADYTKRMLEAYDRYGGLPARNSRED